MVLVTGAAGKTGRAVVRALAGRGLRVRALVFREEDSLPLRQLGAAEVLAADMRDEGAFRAAASGARAIYHICPNVHPEEVKIGQAAMAAARSSEVERFVYHSVLLPAVEAMPHHWLKHRVEELLAESGLAYTVLQPCAYMQNLLAQWDSIVELGRLAVPYGVDVEMNLVDLADVAEAAAIVLTTEGHAGASYELCGPQAISPARVADACGRHVGRRVRAEKEDLAAWGRRARTAGLDEYRIEALVRMFGYYDRHGFKGSPAVLESLLGRRPTSFDQFVARIFAGRRSR